MNQNNFFKLFEDIDIDNMSLSDEELKRIYDIEIKKLGLNKKKRFAKKKLKVLLIAAVLIIITITGFTKYKSIVEMFEGIIKGQNNEIMEKSGNAISQTITNNNLKVTLNGIIGDENKFYIVLDIEDITGKTLKAIDYEGTELYGNLSFNECFFDIVEDEFNMTPSSVKDIDKDKTDNKARLLIDGSIISSLIGKTGVLKLTNLVEKVNGTGTNILMNTDNIYDIYMIFNSDYDIEQSKELKKDIKTKNSNLFINNILFENGILYLNLEVSYLKQSEPFNKFAESFALKNINTGELINSTYHTSTFNNLNNIGQIKFEFDFGKSFSVEDLKNYNLVENVGEIYIPVIEGEWNFEFPITYESETKIYDLDKEIKIKEYPIKITTLKISPISIEVGGYIMKKIEDTENINIVSEDGKASLIMKDGTIIDIKLPYFMYNNNVDGEYLTIGDRKIDAPTLNPLLNFSYESDTIIDINEVKTIQIGDNIIELN